MHGDEIGSVKAKENFVQVVTSNSGTMMRDVSWGWRWGIVGMVLRLVCWDLWGERGDLVYCELHGCGELVLLMYWITGRSVYLTRIYPSLFSHRPWT
jgi:hypothetical protein